MERFVKGDIVVTPFPFSDLSSSIKRPALVVADLIGDEFVLCPITTKNRPDPYKIDLPESEFNKGRIRISSFIIPSRLFTLNGSIFLYKAGSINNEKIQEVENKICEIIRS